MAMQTDVKSTHLNASGTVFSGPTRLKGFTLCATASAAGTVVFKDGGSGGTTLCEVDIPSNSNPNSFYVLIPGEGIKFNSSVYAAITNLASVTAFYG